MWPVADHDIGDFDRTSHPEQRAYRIYSNKRRPRIYPALNKRRIWDKKSNKRRGPNAALIRGIPYN